MQSEKTLIQKILQERVKFFYDDCEEEFNHIFPSMGKMSSDDCDRKIYQTDSLKEDERPILDSWTGKKTNVDSGKICQIDSLTEEGERPILEAWNGLYRDDWDD